MFRFSGVISILIITLLIQACAPKSQTDCGFVQNVYGERISWKGNVPVEMFLHSSVPDELIPAIVEAASVWRNTAGHPLIKINPNKVYLPPNPERDSRNVIYFLDTWEPNRRNEQGRTSVYWVGDQIKEADIRINAKDFLFTWTKEGLSTFSGVSKTSVEIESLMVHEFGHVLGLKHNDSDESSVMATYLSASQTRVTPSVVDRGSLQCEY